MRKQLRMERLLAKALSNLKGKKCWAIIGKSNARTISLDFGERIKRGTPINNPTISEVSRTYTSEYCLLIYCRWEIQQDKKVLCNYHDSYKLLDQYLLNKEIKDIELFDKETLMISFENDIVMYVDSDPKMPCKSDNYTFYLPKGSYSLEGGLKITFNE